MTKTDFLYKIGFITINQLNNLKMKKLSLLLATLLFLALTSFGQTQGEMNSTASISYANADKELNLVYQSILKEYSKDTVFIKNLKIAQNIWIKSRDADLNAIFTPDGWYGSMEPLCKSVILERLTKDRIAFLKTWTEGIDHRDGCKGTRKVKQ
jgi:uncharacterized protein YecT (DUF1311 family)